MTKKCNKCKKVKNVTKFYSRGTDGGYKHICILCCSKYNKRTQCKGSKHYERTKINSQRHRDEMSDMYVRGLICKKSDNLNPNDIPIELVQLWRISLELKRSIRENKC